MLHVMQDITYIYIIVLEHRSQPCSRSIFTGRNIHLPSTFTHLRTTAQCKERQPWWEARSNARRPYCQGTSPQPGQGGGAGRERREEWRRHQPVECSVNFCSVQWLCSSKTMRIYLKKKNLQLLKSQLQSSFSGWVVLKKAAHSREWSETFTPLFTAIDTWIDP